MKNKKTIIINHNYFDHIMLWKYLKLPSSLTMLKSDMSQNFSKNLFHSKEVTLQLLLQSTVQTRDEKIFI